MEQEIFLSLILPAYNEEKRLPDCFEKLSGFVEAFQKPIEVILIENGSADRTYEMGLAFAEQNRWMKVIHLEKNGKGNAVRHGMLAARGQYRMFADVDFAMPISEIPKFLPPSVKDCDLAIASRQITGSVRYNEPFLRRISSFVFNLIVQILLVPGIHDTQCGFKCFTAEAAEKIFPVQQVDGWAFDAELIFLAQLYGFRIKEIPIRVSYEGNSKVNVFRDSLAMFSDLLAIRKNYSEGKYRI